VGRVLSNFRESEDQQYLVPYDFFDCLFSTCSTRRPNFRGAPTPPADTLTQKLVNLLVPDSGRRKRVVETAVVAYNDRRVNREEGGKGKRIDINPTCGPLLLFSAVIASIFQTHPIIQYETFIFGPIPWGHSGPLCHALTLSSLSSTSMRRRRATVPLATSAEWA